jgi:ABC-type uncharacterized transport system YnjBCD substrate-binding protein
MTAQPVPTFTFDVTTGGQQWLPTKINSNSADLFYVMLWGNDTEFNKYLDWVGKSTNNPT